MEKELYKKFSDLNISYEIFEHEPFFTCAEATDFVNKNPGGHAKTLFLRDKKKRHYFLAIVEPQHTIDTKKLCNYFNCAGGKLSFASANDLETILKVTPGSVTPFALINDREKIIKKVLIDTALTKHASVYFHPMRNTATIKMSQTDFSLFLSKVPHQIENYIFEPTKK